MHKGPRKPQVRIRRIEGYSQIASAKVTTQVVRFTVQGFFACGRVAFFILLDIVDEPMNGSSYAQCATLNISKPCSFNQLTLNREPWNF